MSATDGAGSHVDDACPKLCVSLCIIAIRKANCAYCSIVTSFLSSVCITFGILGSEMGACLISPVSKLNCVLCPAGLCIEIALRGGAQKYVGIPPRDFSRGAK